ncbi:asparagine synthase (glutamine-hydrolyzing) [Paenibacillus septentrionalis]|uniref:asparagine synthase (glutamine-hydrolyzing) n=1 Tax=Paenibacillus septentrionalis TaxID=429342 RepID=A0ABW1UZG4_9BACL
MCGITGWINWRQNLLQHSDTLEAMTETLTARGPDAGGTWLSVHCALGHRRLAVMDPSNGAQPMVRYKGSDQYVIVYNGEIYNAMELTNELKQHGWKFSTTCDTEVLLLAYMQWGKECLDRLNGIFAFAIWDVQAEELFAARDRLGVKPFFYYEKDGQLIFGSELKAILANPNAQPIIGAEGLAEVFAVGPARTPGQGIYEHFTELKAGQCMTVSRAGKQVRTYWQLEAREHEHSLDETVEQVRSLLLDTMNRQMISDVPICTLLSGGLDSSALTAMAVQYYRDAAASPLHTYSIDYVDNDKHFKAHAFQPNSDAPFIELMTKHLSTVHHYLQFDTPELIDALHDATLARDLPGMADIDSSLLLFCREIKKNATVAISGEAADEIFGGYPWFHKEETLQAKQFPWSLATAFRSELLEEDVRQWIKPEQYVSQRFEEAVAEVPQLQQETHDLQAIRRMSYMNITRFMPTLLDRKDRMSMAAGLEVRVPFCDHRLVEYVFNIPWEFKTSGDREKGILRKALKGILPDEIITRKKSPYPKTHNPAYLKAVRQLMEEVLSEQDAQIFKLISRKKIEELMKSEQSASLVPWFGQLMSGPQLYAYLYQVHVWLTHYRVRIV